MLLTLSNTKKDQHNIPQDQTIKTKIVICSHKANNHLQEYYIEGYS